jgi:hypothetical protein
LGNVFHGGGNHLFLGFTCFSSLTGAHRLLTSSFLQIVAEELQNFHEKRDVVKFFDPQEKA